MSPLRGYLEGESRKAKVESSELKTENLLTYLIDILEFQGVIMQNSR